LRVGAAVGSVEGLFGLVQGGGTGSFVIDPPGLRDGWCTPWYWFGTGSGGDSQSCGWRLGWDASKVYLYNHSAVLIRVRWAALDF